MDDVYSHTKLEELKKSYRYYNHIQELGIATIQDLEYIPKEFSFFMKQNKPIETLEYCNAIYYNYFEQAEGKEINESIFNTLASIGPGKLNEMKQLFIDNDIMTPLLKRAKATYQIDFDRSAGNKVTQSLLHIYSSAYENTECLYILYWIVKALKNKPLTNDFKSYMDKYGNVEKGRLLNNILSECREFNDFKDILSKAYYKKMRHLCFHNAAELNDETEFIVSIENPDVKVSYEEAFSSFFALQQLHNYLRLFATILLIEEKYIENEGVFSSVTISFESGNSQLHLLQLFPFYEYDSNRNKKMQRLYVKDDGDQVILHSDKEIISIKKDPLIENWYKNKGEGNIRIVPAYPNIYKEGKFPFVLKTKEYGDFVIGSGYEVEIYFS